MESLSWIFFCLSPFALFCSENGNGLILCPIFIILGFVFKYVGNNGGGGATVKIDPNEFWEWHYKDRIRSTLAQKDTISDGLMALRDKEARRWATTICGYHNAWVPPENVQEQIARENGVITEKMVKEKNEKIDRIQIGKSFLMCKLKLKYDRPKTWHTKKEIENDMRKIKLSNDDIAEDWFVERKYGKTVAEIWEVLSLEEKQQAEKWIEEYEEKLILAIQDYEKNKEFSIRHVKMDF